jgi:hypothetical protein
MADPKDGIQGLPVKGYKQTQTQEAIEAVNYNKVMEEQVLRRVEYLGQPERDLPLTGDGQQSHGPIFRKVSWRLTVPFSNPNAFPCPATTKRGYPVAHIPPGGGDDDSE